MATINRKPFGTTGAHVSAQGLGCMGLSWAYASALEGNVADKEEFLRQALNEGITLFNSANIYVGPQVCSFVALIKNVSTSGTH